ncbi:hypothetical protein CLM71_07325 [Serratia sp. MYb239]|uniref:haloacid dehalogenase-like hydrolase n=1 Tax=Serratia sp. MYb239 TaxID=2033438 RepID=UPI000CF5F30E|nr:haloacid dehalogenase-like hydrolase [Serratia sp. MYb239]AVJ16954.1 hypothetical protein CLM71_07325 [Serratia sp. MYb239]MCA4822970.1 haloacid dehalogenase-like hydrolase [Serratia rubidaea]
MKYIAYDLDGTLIKFNTFKVWVILSFILSLIFFRIPFLKKFIGLVKSRKQGDLDRLGFKISLLALQVNSTFWSKVGSVYGGCLAKYFLRKDLLALHKSAERCLATAAPDIYAIPFSKKLGLFKTVICSHFVSDSGDYIETLNEEKKNAVLNDFSSHPDILFTDHYDDLPLIQMCKFSYLVSPDKSSKEKFIRVLSVDAYKIID